MVGEKATQNRAGESGIVVSIDRRIWKEICDYFPIEGVRKNIAKKHWACRMIIAAKVLCLVRSDDKTFMLNQTVMDKMKSVSHRKRKKIIEYLHSSRYFEIETDYSVGHHSIIWSIHGVALKREVDQHNMTLGIGSGIFGIVDERGLRTHVRGSGPCIKGGLSSWDVQWSFAGECDNVFVHWDWFREYGRSFRVACTAMFGTEWGYVQCVEHAVKVCHVDVPALAQCKKLVTERLAREDLRLSARERRTLVAGTAEYWMRSWSEWANDPLLYLIRIKGRVYYPLVSQPRDLRYRYLRWRLGDDFDEAAEVDMSSTYWVLLANRLHDSECKRRLVSELVAGTFYQSLNAAIGMKYSDTAKLKVAVQIHCLFGSRNFGRSALFRALESLYPDLAKYIRSQRSHRGVSGLSTMLMIDESRFFIDSLLPAIVRQGIPGLPIHDAVVVPRSAAELVRETCQSLAEGHFGFRPRFKISDRVAAI